MESPAFSLGRERHLITKVPLLIPRLKQDRDRLGGGWGSISASWGSGQIERRRITRSQYVEDMLFLLYPELKKPLKECRLLDLGSGLGTNAIPAAKIVRSVFGIDTNAPHVNRAREWAEREGLNNITFRVGSATDLDLGPFDIVLCDYLLEHVEDPNSLISVIARHLEPHGAYFLSTNNKWWPLEGHYGLPIPLISWLPRAWANRYVRLMRFGTEYSVYPISWNRLEELLERNELTWSLKPPTRPYTAAQKVGKRLVQISPAFWKIANVFQVVGRRKETAK